MTNVRGEEGEKKRASPNSSSWAWRMNQGDFAVFSQLIESRKASCWVMEVSRWPKHRGRPQLESILHCKFAGRLPPRIDLGIKRTTFSKLSLLRSSSNQSSYLSSNLQKLSRHNGLFFFRNHFSSSGSCRCSLHQRRSYGKESLRKAWCRLELRWKGFCWYLFSRFLWVVARGFEETTRVRGGLWGLSAFAYVSLSFSLSSCSLDLLLRALSARGWCHSEPELDTTDITRYNNWHAKLSFLSTFFHLSTHSLEQNMEWVVMQRTAADSGSSPISQLASAAANSAWVMGFNGE